ncbi:Serine/threonine-protein kinase ATR [Gracilariopsis chorda]|uniref:Serine/threonine-protein kinase ATR n=1 Tax=Gracilariopsis chorda TaxID=448386 RepID=A0A2V3IMZ6_9FLOR|nr:Serine/threonine-protein kinase ATR [Gracilariopsis chorda]|eukprot:PXF43442.1 Serine/threonine-protein kinase ATR [Gracilariopsis chorda]
MAPPVQEEAHPQTLISTLLTHLPSFRNKPEIALAAFQTIRRASQTSSVAQLSVALLAPLTALSLNSASHTVRFHAAQVCVSLLKSLVLRRFTKLTSAYVLDLVALANRVVAHDSTHPLLCTLPNFSQHAVTVGHSHCDVGVPPKEILHLPANSSTLAALLYLLALFIPSNLPFDHQSNLTSQVLRDHHAAQPYVSADAIKLWNCIGQKVHNALLHLAASQLFLSGRCGTQVATSAIYIWQRAFDPASGYLVPPIIRENLCIIVNSILKQSYSTHHQLLTQHLRAALYALSQLSDPVSKIDASLWAECGIREAAEPTGTLSLQLRSFSRSGLVQSCVVREGNDDHSREHATEPPRKKRRTDAYSAVSTAHHNGGSGSAEPSQYASGDEHRPTVSGLLKSLQALPSIDICATKPKCILLLANASSLTADSIANLCGCSSECSESLDDWVSFASSLSQISKDVVRTKPSIVNKDHLEAFLCLARACHRLSTVLVESRTLNSERSTTTEPLSANDFGGVNMSLLTSVMNVCAYACEFLKGAGNDFPTAQLEDLLMEVSEAIREEHVHASTLPALKSCCARLINQVLSRKPSDPIRLPLLRASLEMSQALGSFSPDTPVEVLIQEMCDLICTSKSTVASDTFYVLKHAICLYVKCSRSHGVTESCEEPMYEEDKCLDEDICVTVLESLKDAMNAISGADTLAALFESVCALGFHCTRAHSKDVADFVTRLLENDKNSTVISSSSAFFKLLSLGERKADEDDESVEETHGDESKQLNKVSTNKEEDLIVPLLVHRRLRQYAHSFMKTLWEDKNDRSVNPTFALFGNLIHHSHQISSPRTVGFVTSGLLARAIHELNELLPLGSASSRTSEAQSDVTFSAPRLCAWNHILLSVAMGSTQYYLSRRRTKSARARDASLTLSSYDGRRTLSSQVGDFVNARSSIFLPYCLENLLHEPYCAQKMAELITEGSKKSFWSRVIRHTVVHLIRSGDAKALAHLAEMSQRSAASIVEKGSADALAIAFMNPSSDMAVGDDSSLRLIRDSLGVSVQEAVRKRFGKIVQRLVMEFGGPKEAQAKHGLVALSNFVRQRKPAIQSAEQVAGILVSSNFMLVMDAVNRGLFNSKATEKDRRCHLRMLHGVLSVSSSQLHLYVPKIMATLKMALDITKDDKQAYLQTLALWKDFLVLLGANRIIPHLGTVFAILMPVLHTRKEMLLGVLQDVTTNITSEDFHNNPSLHLLLRIIKEAFFAAREPQVRDHGKNSSDEPLTIESLHEVCKSIGNVIGHYENDCIEVQASKYMLRALRSHRFPLSRVTIYQSSQPCIAVDSEFGQVASILETLVSHLGKTKSEECQDVLIQCIGEIGAVDPGLLSNRPTDGSQKEGRSKASCQRFPRSIYGLVSLLLDDFLVNSLRKGERQDSSNSRFNRVGLVIQELLRVCGCKKYTPTLARRTELAKSTQYSNNWEAEMAELQPDDKASLFWENLSSTTRDAVQPYLAEPFDVNQYQHVFGEDSEGDIEKVCQPVWSKLKALTPVGKRVTAQEWIRQITVQLVDFIGKKCIFGEPLKALRPILRYEDQVNGYVFPLVVTSALDAQHDMNRSEVKQFLVGEIEEVLKESASPLPMFDLLDTLRIWRDQRSHRRGTVSHRSTYVRNSNDGSFVSRKRIPLATFIDLAKRSDPLTDLVDLEGREISELSLLTQAKAAFSSRSFHRAIMLAECHVRNLRTKKGFPGWASYIEQIPGRSNENGEAGSEAHGLKVLQQAFAAIEDVPNMKGIAFLRSKTSLTERVTDAEAAGEYDEALITYEHALAEEPRNPAFHSETELRQTATANGIAAAWRLGRWKKLEQLRNAVVDTTVSQSAGERLDAPWILGFSSHFANLYLSFRKKDLTQVEHDSFEARRHILQPLLRAAKESYHRAYPLITLVHSLCEVEDAARCLLASAPSERHSEPNDASANEVQRRGLLHHAKRLQRTSTSLRVREPLLSSRRVCFDLLDMPNEAAQANLELAQLARESDNLKAASASAFRALTTPGINSAMVNAASIETAHIRRAHGDVAGALLLAKREADRLTVKLKLKDSSVKQLSADEAATVADQLCTALVLAGTWSEEIRSETSETILRYLEKAVRYGPTREEPFYALGKHYDSLLQAGANVDTTVALTSDLGNKVRRRHPMAEVRAGNHNQYVPKVIRSFARALSNGHTRIFEALPRMVTVWFNFHTEISESRTAPPRGAAYEEEVQREMKRAMSIIPHYMWMTAIPQLMSRILHARKEVRDNLKEFLATIVCEFPDQSFWLILPSTQLRSVERKKATADILSSALTAIKRSKQKDARECSKAMKIRIQNALNVIRSFEDICVTLLPKDRRGKKDNCAKEFSALRRLLRKTNGTPNVIIPTLQSLTVQLPDSNGGEHRSFGNESVRIVDIDDEVLVMNSLMRPRRISLIGSDGVEYRYLAKKETQGDIRRDSRLVEFITVVNRLLSRDVCSRGKKLALKTYAVLPLSEETGMIEWVNDLEALRNVVQSEHFCLGTIPDTRMIQRHYEHAGSKREFLEKWAFEKFPPVLDKFFVKKFGGGADAQRWLKARNSWAESTAVWSMAGYIVGLGDRHGENVLVESTSGRCVHVDFAMLFDKGLTLKVPEIVPFRLTRNVVCAMGIAGYEGLYRSVAEMVLGSMRRNSEAVLGVLESFLHDPLADWSRGERGGCGEGTTGKANKEAQLTIAAVKAKLTGVVDISGLALSICGQVERLIQEASCVDKLSQMYLWWGAWM